MASTWFPTIGPAQSLVWHAGPFGEFGPRRQDTEILAECPAAGQKQGSTGCRHIFLFVNSTGPEAFPHMLRDPAAFPSQWPNKNTVFLETAAKRPYNPLQQNNKNKNNTGHNVFTAQSGQV